MIEHKIPTIVLALLLLLVHNISSGDVNSDECPLKVTLQLTCGARPEVPPTQQVAQLNLGQQSSVAQADSEVEMQESDPNELLEGLVATPKVVRRAVERIEPSLVTIESFGGVSTRSGQIGGIRRQGEGNTTGLVISADGYVMTSLFNFIQQPQRITVKTSDGVRRVAELVGRDETRNLCLLKIEGVLNLPVPEFVPESKIQVGQFAISVGVGFGDANTAISTGIVSAKNRIGGRAIQTDANISPANYGGPLLDIEGRVIGICVPLVPGGTSAGAGVEWYDSGIGFAISIVDNQSLIERLKRGESIEPGFIGIRPVFTAQTNGAKVSEVTPDSPAEQADVRVNDIVIRIDEHQVVDQVSMQQIVNRYAAGDLIKLTVLRNPHAIEPKDSEADGSENSKDTGNSDATQKSEDKPNAEQAETELTDPDSLDDWIEVEIEIKLGKRPKT